MNVENRVRAPESTKTDWLVAQWLEQEPYTFKAISSNLILPTIKRMRLGVNGNISIFLLFLRGKHKMAVFSSNLKVALPGLGFIGLLGYEGYDFTLIHFVS